MHIKAALSDLKFPEVSDITVVVSVKCTQPAHVYHPGCSVIKRTGRDERASGSTVTLVFLDVETACFLGHNLCLSLANRADLQGLNEWVQHVQHLLFYLCFCSRRQVYF